MLIFVCVEGMGGGGWGGVRRTHNSTTMLISIFSLKFFKVGGGTPYLFSFLYVQNVRCEKKCEGGRHLHVPQGLV